MEKKYTSDLKTLISIHDDLEKKRKPATILFADLVGSTSYKLKKRPIEAEAKIYLHNETVTELVNDCNGDVVKYLGDGVMAKFEGNEAEVNAVNAASKIQKVFDRYNKKPGLPELDKVQTKIGINSGEVSFWELKGQEQPDPQGTPVDIASRIADLAKPIQILSSENIKNKCEGKVEDVSFSDSVPRELKGVTPKVQICEVIWLKELGIKEVVHFSVPDRQIENLLYSARKAEIEGDYNKAITEYKHILEHDGQHFIANLVLANIFLKNDKPEEAMKHTKAAKESNPWSAGARLLMGVLPWIISENEGTGPLSSEMFESIIDELEVALEQAQEEVDDSVKLAAMNNLAYFYADRYDQKKDNKDLEESEKICKYLDEQYKWIRHYREAAFLDTYGCVLMRKGDAESLKKAKEKFQESTELSPYAPWPHEHIGNLMKIARRKGISLENS